MREDINTKVQERFGFKDRPEAFVIFNRPVGAVTTMPNGLKTSTVTHEKVTLAEVVRFVAEETRAACEAAHREHVPPVVVKAGKSTRVLEKGRVGASRNTKSL